MVHVRGFRISATYLEPTAALFAPHSRIFVPDLAGRDWPGTRPAWACDAVTALILSDPEVIEAHIAGEPLATQTGRQLSRDPSHDSRVVVGQWWPRY
jgi:hypothetical protein